MQLTASVKRKNDDWYICTIETKSGQLATGYGTTHTKALQDAFRDLEVINKLQCRAK